MCTALLRSGWYVFQFSQASSQKKQKTRLHCNRAKCNFRSICSREKDHKFVHSLLHLNAKCRQQSLTRHALHFPWHIIYGAPCDFVYRNWNYGSDEIRETPIRLAARMELNGSNVYDSRSRRIKKWETGRTTAKLLSWLKNKIDF